MAVNTILKKSGTFRVGALLSAFILSTGSARPGLSAAKGFPGSTLPGMEISADSLPQVRQTAEAAVDEEKLMKRFKDHIKQYYFDPILEEMTLQDSREWWDSRILDARVLGYFLGQQLKHIQMGTKEHKHWLILERRCLAGLEKLANQLGDRLSLTPREIARRTEEFHTQFQLATQGWLDPQMAVLTGITPGTAPNFFDSSEYLSLFRTDNAFLESIQGIWILRNYTPARDYEGMTTWTYRFTREQARHGYSIDIYNDQDNIKKGMAFWKAMGEYMLWMTSRGQPWVLFKRMNYNLFYGVILREGEIAHIRDNGSLPASMDGILRNWPPRSYYSLKRKR